MQALVAGLQSTPRSRAGFRSSRSPYTEDDALAFVRGEVRPDARSTRSRSRSEGGRRRGIGLSGRRPPSIAGRIGYWCAGVRERRRVCTPRALRLLRASACAQTRAPAASSSFTGTEELVASQRVAEKVGFQREGVLRCAPAASGRARPRLGDVLAATRRASTSDEPETRPLPPAPSSRRRRTRASSGGCVLNIRARPSLSNGSIG